MFCGAQEGGNEDVTVGGGHVGSGVSLKTFLFSIPS